MRYILIFWAVPMAMFWSWYYLSYNDMHFGYLFLSRLVHDYTFDLYAGIIGVEASSIPPLLVRACIVDTCLIFSILAFRRRRELRAWFARRRQRYSESSLPNA